MEWGEGGLGNHERMSSKGLIVTNCKPPIYLSRTVGSKVPKKGRSKLYAVKGGTSDTRTELWLLRRRRSGEERRAEEELRSGVLFAGEVGCWLGCVPFPGGASSRRCAPPYYTRNVAVCQVPIAVLLALLSSSHLAVGL